MPAVARAPAPEFMEMRKLENWDRFPKAEPKVVSKPNFWNKIFICGVLLNTLKMDFRPSTSPRHNSWLVGVIG